MDSITQFFISQYTDCLNIGFICNLMIFCVVLEGMAVMIGHMSNVGR